MRFQWDFGGCCLVAWCFHRHGKIFALPFFHQWVTLFRITAWVQVQCPGSWWILDHPSVICSEQMIHKLFLSGDGRCNCPLCWSRSWEMTLQRHTPVIIPHDSHCNCWENWCGVIFICMWPMEDGEMYNDSSIYYIQSC